MVGENASLFIVVHKRLLGGGSERRAHKRLAGSLDSRFRIVYKAGLLLLLFLFVLFSAPVRWGKIVPGMAFYKRPSL